MQTPQYNEAGQFIDLCDLDLSWHQIRRIANDVSHPQRQEAIDLLADESAFGE